MSRIISAVCIAIFIAGVCVSSIAYSSHFTDNVSEMIERIYNGKTDDINEFEEKWSEYNEIAALYYDHNDLEKVTALISSLSEFDSGSDVFFRVNCKELETIMEHLKESQLPEFNNIF